MPFVRRRPLLRMAAVGGVAYMGARAGTNRAMQAQSQQAQGQAGQGEPAQSPPPAPVQAAAPPPVAAPAAADPVAQLQQLAQLHQSGALSDEEFAQAKARILG